VSGAGEKRHDGDIIGLDLVENANEAGLTLMKGYGHLVEEPASSQRLCNPADQCIRSGLPA
jgi:hypothetical protein